jgi:hypothetical protein
VPGFVSGLIHAGAVGATGYAEGQDENQRKMLALAQQRRAQQREDEEADLKRIDALAKARDAGLTVTPQASERSGDTFGSVGASIRGVAGPAEEAKPTRVGTVAGMDITVPDKYEPKAVRDKRAAIEAGVEKPPEQTLHGRIIELRSQGMKPEDAIRQARQEFGQEDPMALHRQKRDYDVTHPTRSSSDGATPERRAAYVLRRASQLTQAKRDPSSPYIRRMIPGMSRSDAEQQAGEEYDRVHGIETQVTTPSAKTAPATNGTTPPPPANDPRLNRTGDALSPADQAMAAKDPKFRAWLISKGKLKGP